MHEIVVCLSVCLMYVYHMRVWCPQNPAEGIKSPGTIVAEATTWVLGKKTWVLCWSSKCSLTTEPSLQTQGDGCTVLVAVPLKKVTHPAEQSQGRSILRVDLAIVLQH